MIALFDRVEAEVGPIEVAVFNIGANVEFPDRRNDGARLHQGLGKWRASAVS